MTEDASSRGAEDVLIVPASRAALDDYERLSAYVCQPNRSFRNTHYLAFYADGKIDRRIPRILDRVDNVVLSREAIDADAGLAPRTRLALGSLVGRLAHGRTELLGTAHEVFILSGPDNPETLRLPREIVNDQKTTAGRTVGFVRRQRYVPLRSLTAGPMRTSELAPSSGAASSSGAGRRGRRTIVADGDAR